MTKPVKEKKRLPAPIYKIEKAVRDAGLHPSRIAWDSYFIPGTDTLRNKLGSSPRSYGIADPDLLEELETELSMSSMVQLQNEPVKGNFDLAHMQAIHQRLFADVYEWAGQLRTVGLNKRGHEYGHADQIQDRWMDHASLIRGQNQLIGITDHQEFSGKLARHWGGINYAHAFREGNTRSQTVFFHQMATQAGWDLDITRLDPAHPDSLREEFVDARFHFQDTYNHTGLGDWAPLATVLEEATAPTVQKQTEIQQYKKTAGPSRYEQLMARIEQRASLIEDPIEDGPGAYR